ncbi:MAG: amidohydrolase family protein [Gemmatimonadaceae bacterium]
MRRQSVLSLCRYLGAAIVATGASVVRAQEPAIAITRVTLVDPARDAPLRDASIVVQGDRIIAAGPRRAVSIPRNARVIDATGKFAIPGLWDMHTHVAQPAAPGANLETGAAYFLPLFIAHGVTGVRDMAGDLVTLRRWREEIARGSRVGPRLVVTGEKLGKGAVVAAAPFPIRTPDDIALSVKALKDGEADFVKLDVVAPELLAALMRESKALGIPVAGHVEIVYSVRELSRAGVRSVEHLDGVLLAANSREDALRRELQQNRRATLWHRLMVKARMRRAIAFPEVEMVKGYSATRADSLHDLFRQNDTWHCPTLRLLGALHRQTDANLRLPPDSLLPRAVPSPWNGYINAPFDAKHPLTAVYPKLQEAVRRMSARGVGLLAGTDTPGLAAVPGRSLHEELGLLVAAGLTPREALRAATTSPGAFLGASDSLGAIRVGAVADLVLLDGDPVGDIAQTQRIRAVIARGRLYDRAALDRLIGEAAVAARRLRASAP